MQINRKIEIALKIQRTESQPSIIQYPSITPCGTKPTNKRFETDGKKRHRSTAALGVLKLNNGEKYENNELQTTRRGMR